MSERTTEFQLAAYALANPEMVLRIVEPSVRFLDTTAGAVFDVLRKHGPTFAAPGPLVAQLNEDEVPYDEKDLFTILHLVPDEDELAELVTTSNVNDLKVRVEGAGMERAFHQYLQAQAERIRRGGNFTEIVAEINEKASTVLKKLSGVEQETTILEKLKDKTRLKTRWKSGYEGLDDLFPGMGPSINGVEPEPSTGLFGQKELVMLIGGNKTGKTRRLVNWVNVLLDQGARVLIMVLEDDDTTYALKLMAAKFDVPKWVLERYLTGYGYVGSDPELLAVQERCGLAEEWWAKIEANGQIIIVDGNDRHDVFNFRRAMEISEQLIEAHGITHVAYDYVQAWGAKDQAEGMVQAFTLRALAAKRNVCVIGLSQVSNQTMREGSANGMLAAKGAGDWGAAAHIGFELQKDWSIEQDEICLDMKIARDASPQQFFDEFNRYTGTIYSTYDTAKWMWQSAPVTPKKRGK